MPRPSTAITAFTIPGRRYGGVRVNRPSKNDSYRILFTDDDGHPRERTRVGLASAEQAAEAAPADEPAADAGGEPAKDG